LKLRTILVEDEPDALEHLASLVEHFCENVVVVGQASDVNSALRSINQLDPDLVIMDIRLPDGTAFDILTRLPEINFSVIFTTAYTEYAIKAFKISAIDYLLKPVEIDELVEAVKKAEKNVMKQNIDQRINTLLNNISSKSGIAKKIVVQTNYIVHVIPVSEIIYCQGISRNVFFFTKDGDEIQSTHTIMELEDILADYGFFRTNRQNIINLDFIRLWDKTRGGNVIMSNGVEIPLSYRRREMLMELINARL
jgi:two-component system, LytTR family, response regulator